MNLSVESIRAVRLRYTSMVEVNMMIRELWRQENYAYWPGKPLMPDNDNLGAYNTNFLRHQ